RCDPGPGRARGGQCGGGRERRRPAAIRRVPAASRRDRRRRPGEPEQRQPRSPAMTQPTPDRIGAAIEALRAEAEVWNDIHERLNRCATHVRTLPITEYADVTTFAPFLKAYNDVVERYAVRCAEGA